MYTLLFQMTEKPSDPYLIYLVTIIYEAGFILMKVLLNQIMISFVYLVTLMTLLLYIETKEIIACGGLLFFTRGFESKSRCYAHWYPLEYSCANVLYLRHIHYLYNILNNSLFYLCCINTII